MHADPEPSHQVIDPRDHMRWAERIAKVVSSDFGFGKRRRKSQERDELIGVAFLVLCEYAAKFSPWKALTFRAGPAIVRRCRAWAPGERVPRPPVAVPFYSWDLLPWAVKLAGLVADELNMRRGKGGRAALAAVAALTAAEHVAAFDPGGAFRGWARIAVKGECQRAAMRLHNGGVYRTTEVEEMKWYRTPGVPDPRVYGHACDEYLGGEFHGGEQVDVLSTRRGTSRRDHVGEVEAEAAADELAHGLPPTEQAFVLAWLTDSRCDGKPRLAAEAVGLPAGRVAALVAEVRKRAASRWT